MSQRPALVVLAPNFPPAVCGVGDYTANLLRAWPRADHREIRCLLRPIQAIAGAPRTLELPDRDPVPIRDFAPHYRPLRDALSALGSCDLLVQYSAYGYDPRWGCPARICDALVAWTRARRGRLVVMFHELWADEWPRWHPHFWVQAWHRKKLGELARAATHLFTTTELSAARLRALMRGADRPAPVSVLPVGSNIPRASAFPDTPTAKLAEAPPRERGLFVLFGSQGTRVRCLRAIRDALSALAKRRRLGRLVLLGVGQGEAMAREEQEILRAIFPDAADAVETLGELPAPGIAVWLGRAEFGLSFQSEVNFTKSGTLMAYFAHGLNVLSPFAGKDRPEPFSALTHPDELLAAGVDDKDGSVPSAGGERALALRQWHDQHAAWPRLAAAFASAFNQPG